VAVNNCIVLVANNDVDVDAASEISAIILNSPKLEMILAGSNIFGSMGSFVIGDALSHCTNIRIFDLGNTHMDEPIAERLHNVVFNNAFLQKLCLNDCNLTYNCFKKIAESLKYIASLKVLNCSNNNMYIRYSGNFGGQYITTRVALMSHKFTN